MEDRALTDEEVTEMWADIDYDLCTFRSVHGLGLGEEELLACVKATIAAKNEKIAELVKALFASVQDTCKTGYQQCRICDSMECCDNRNPLVKRIKELEKETHHG